MDWNELIPLLEKGTGETLIMTFVSTLFVLLGGLPLGVLLVATSKGWFWEKRALNAILGTIVNIVRSAPFVILMVAIVPFTRLVVGTSIGTKAAIVPLVVAAIPFMARVVEQSLREVDPGLVEAAIAMGSSNWQLIYKVLIPEALPSLVRGTSLMIINLIGLGAMAGAVGGGGLGDYAVKYGYYRYETAMMVLPLIILVLLVQLIQWIGDRIAAALTHN